MPFLDVKDQISFKSFIFLSLGVFEFATEDQINNKCFYVSLSCDGVVECYRVLRMTLFLDLAICYGCDHIYLSYFLFWLNQLYLVNILILKKLGSTKVQVADRPWPSWHCRILLKGKSIRRSVAKDVPCSKSACMYLSSLHLNGVFPRQPMCPFWTFSVTISNTTY